MKLLFDLFPVILFFLTFKVAQIKIDTAMSVTNALLGGGIDPAQAPVLCATTIAIAASVIQVATVLLRGRRVEMMLWLSLSIVTIFGGLTLWLHNPLFIKWKPTILYWVFAAILTFGSLTRRNFMEKIMGRQIELPANVWETLQRAWIGFFAVVGVINLLVAYSFSTETWVNFKLFGLLGLTFGFALVMGIYMAKHAPEEAAQGAKKPVQDNN
ncbi:septation protein A [Mesosutterella sp. AGMB02718]|uniref:Inner membrane-spanning protein YciB n=1 Tax=Mesosutterella faecium TaxID=2925194 RepID=A0ABT7IN85_9BURK|nr:septation protein A [Mesosutterella sp. AGMB02718]MDL2059844.1 septation protein A [Mesosutterella sp. AGMB02718]